MSLHPLCCAGRRAAIELALERRDLERELISQLLSALYATEISMAEIVRGFEHLLARVDDLAIDNPQASEHLAAFMTRRVLGAASNPFAALRHDALLSSPLPALAAPRTRPSLTSSHPAPSSPPRLACPPAVLPLSHPVPPPSSTCLPRRAVADEILPPAFVTSPPTEGLTTPLQLDTLTKARAPLAASHFGERRYHVWGSAADGTLEHLKKAVKALCDEYLVSGELEEV